jgi:hypothetical protein
MTSYPKEHNKVVILTQQGGCGAHFIISLASFYFNSCNNQSRWKEHLIDEFNGYVGIQSVFEDNTSPESNLTELIDKNVKNNDYIFKGLKLQELLDPSLYSIQQCHVSVKELNQSQLGPSNKVIRVFTEDLKTMKYCMKLDSIKNKNPHLLLVLKKYEEKFSEYIGHNTQPVNNLDLFDFNYNEIILKSNYEEFINFANWLEVAPMPKHIFKFRTNHYNKKNKETLDTYL